MRYLLCVLLLAALPFALAQHAAVSKYALILKNAPLAETFPTKESRNSPEARKRLEQIRSKQAELKTELQNRNIEIVGTVDTVMNAVFVAVSPDRVPELQALSGVKEVVLINRRFKRS